MRMKKVQKQLFVFVTISLLIALVGTYIGSIYRYTSFEYARQYGFSDGVIDEYTLKSYLSRAVTQAEYLTDYRFISDVNYGDRSDDTRMLQSIGAKFIGRAIYQWNRPEIFNDPDFLMEAQKRIEVYHAVDSDVVFQAAIFEIVSTKVNQVPIPAWMFEEFDLPIENRNFDYERMIDPYGKFVNHWGEGASVPDITRLETQLFFYYMARNYLEIGIEAIHFGQVELMAMNDREQNYSSWDSLLTRIRAAALTYARRGTVIIDGHLPMEVGYTLKVDDRLIFDFVSFPIRPIEMIFQSGKVSLMMLNPLAIYGKTKGGITPSGYFVQRSQYLVEFDNWGISDRPGKLNLFDGFIWGYDEISWFASRNASERNEFLIYAYEWINEHDQYGNLQMPGSRVSCLSTGERVQFRANSIAVCPDCGNIEDTIWRLWSLSDK